MLPALSRSQNFFKDFPETGVIDFAKTFGDLITLTAARTLLGERSGIVVAGRSV